MNNAVKAGTCQIKTIQFAITFATLIIKQFTDYEK